MLKTVTLAEQAMISSNVRARWRRGHARFRDRVDGFSRNSVLSAMSASRSLDVEVAELRGSM